MADGTALGATAGERFFDRLPPHVIAGMTAEQRSAISAVVRERANAPPVNIRLSIPFFGGGFYLSLVAGRERRNAARLGLERTVNPLRTVGNMLFVIGTAFGLYLVIAATILTQFPG